MSSPFAAKLGRPLGPAKGRVAYAGLVVFSLGAIDDPRRMTRSPVLMSRALAPESQGQLRGYRPTMVFRAETTAFLPPLKRVGFL